MSGEPAVPPHPPVPPPPPQLHQNPDLSKNSASGFSIEKNRDKDIPCHLRPPPPPPHPPIFDCPYADYIIFIGQRPAHILHGPLRPQSLASRPERSVHRMLNLLFPRTLFVSALGFSFISYPQDFGCDVKSGFQYRPRTEAQWWSDGVALRQTQR